MWKLTILANTIYFDSYDLLIKHVTEELGTWKEKYKNGARFVFAVAYEPQGVQAKLFERNIQAG